MTRKMFNDCGYAPDFQATMKRMYDTAAVVDKGLTDITWRKDITPHMIRSAYQQELENAKAAVLSGLRAVYDSPGAMESFFSTSILSGMGRTPERYADEIRAVQISDVVESAKTVRFHSSFFLRGEQHE
jgi:hypothetical protein